jgi:hypothetical protein
MAHPLENSSIVVDGDTIDETDLTFAESRKIRQVMAQMGVDDPNDPSIDEYIPALVFVWKQRGTDPFTIEDALNLKFKDIVKPAGNGSRPTRRAAKKD